ncbi:MAG TPA: glycosyltransferase family 39 protein [Candidatus Kryptonia bacterium]|nr:glycosyltransferase family 39 protein [Candidatus Kryptonia bacterium]
MPSSALRFDWPAGAVLTLLCLALYIPGLTTIPPIDRDEARFAQATKQMLATGDVLRPRFQSDYRFKKPIGIYWLQSVAVRIAKRRGNVIWPYRTPSMLGAIAAVLLTYRLGRRLFAWPVASLGAALLASSALLTVEAHSATTDAVLLAVVVAAQGSLAALYASARRGTIAASHHAATFWLSQGAGILIKGPVVPLVSGLTLAALSAVERGSGTEVRRRMLRGLRAAWGVPLMLAVALPWPIAVGWASHGALYREWIGGDLLSKVLGGQESHGAPPGFYLLLAPATFWPGSFAALAGGVRAVRRRARTGERFCLAWLVPTWIFFELMPTKLPHYVLPTYPALALLVARTVAARPAQRRSLLLHRLLRLGFTTWGVLTVAFVLMIVAALADYASEARRPALIAAAVVVVAVAILSTSLGRRGSTTWAAWGAVVASVALFAPLLQWGLPNVDALWLSRAVAGEIAKLPHSVDGQRRLAAVGYHEPSLVFLVDTEVSLSEPSGGVEFLRDHPSGLVLVSDDMRWEFLHAADAVGMQAREIWSIEGIDYSKGRKTRLRLFERPSPAAGLPSSDKQ